MSQRKQVPAEVVEELNRANRVLLVSHVGLDGDHLGCMIALHSALEKMGKQVVAYLPEVVPENFHFLTGLERLSTTLPADQFDLLVSLECPEVHRFPKGFELNGIADRVLNMDHHPDNQMYGDVNWVIPGAAALGEMMFDLLESLEVPLDDTIAMALYTAIFTDTGSFQYSRVVPRTHLRIARLLEFDIDTDLVGRSIYRQLRFEAMKLLGIVLQNTAQSEDGRLVWAELPRAELDRYNVQPEDTLYFVDQLDTVKGAEVVLLFREQPDGRVKVSLRSRHYPVNHVAASFGGGGHAKAAGCVVEGNLSAVRARVVEAMARSLKDAMREDRRESVPAR
ncbi:MAG: DHH family phosphoesterase [Candidatus Eremiobacterota bacterium]